MAGIEVVGVVGVIDTVLDTGGVVTSTVDVVAGIEVVGLIGVLDTVLDTGGVVTFTVDVVVTELRAVLTEVDEEMAVVVGAAVEVVVVTVAVVIAATATTIVPCVVPVGWLMVDVYATLPVVIVLVT